MCVALMSIIEGLVRMRRMIGDDSMYLKKLKLNSNEQWCRNSC